MGDLMSGIGNLLGGVGSFASAFGFGSSSGEDLQKAAARHQIRWRVKDAKLAGIHPLAALGISPAVMQPAMDSRPNLGKVGQDVGRALSQLFSSEQKEAARAEITSKHLDNKLKEVEVAIKQKQLNDLDQGVTMPHHDEEGVIQGQNNTSTTPNSTIHTGVNFRPSEIPLMQSHGIQVGVQPFHQYSVNEYGTYYKVPTKDIQEAISEGSIITQARYNIGQISEQGQALLVFLNPDHPQLQDFKSRWLRSRPKPKKGYVALWNLKRGAWVRYKDDGKNRLFVADNVLLQGTKNLRNIKKSIPKGGKLYNKIRRAGKAARRSYEASKGHRFKTVPSH